MNTLNHNAHGLAIIGGVMGATAWTANKLTSLKKDFDMERAKREDALKLVKKDLDVEKAKREKAVAEARRETAEKFLKYGFTEEYQAYQRLVGIDNEKKLKEKERMKTSA